MQQVNQPLSQPVEQLVDRAIGTTSGFIILNRILTYLAVHMGHI